MQKKNGSSISVTTRPYLYCIGTIERDNCFEKSLERPALRRDHSLCPRFRITTFCVSRTSCSTCSCMKHTGFYSEFHILQSIARPLAPYDCKCGPMNTQTN